ncbi:AGAP001989-PA-like protein [Anopheles sinensis]|uniref:AGAP001989-PA-like protein n=1 Tax=Anopheles sinensis TaxID=74873 RepID=A0A084VHI5_ANOSI|nr:AGAP001989-PA-like protein [Anopheles sinensis]
MYLPSSIRFTLMLSVLWLSVIVSVSGARQKSQLVPDVASTAYSETLHGERKCYNLRVRDANQHIATRLTRYFVFGGILQAIAEQTQIPREDLVSGGPSQNQDQSSGRGPKYHAAHVIRVGSIDGRLKQKNASLNTALQNYIGHTQNVIKAANVWHGVAGQIDLFQSGKLSELAKIDFGGAFEPTNRRKVEDLMTEFRKIIDTHVNSGNQAQEEQSELDAAKIAVHCAGASMLFEAGKEGYQMVKSGNFETHYEKS